MAYYLRMGERDFTFIVDSETRNGWAKMRLIRIEDRHQVQPDISRIETYDPAIHDGGSNYMSHLWVAQRKKYKHDTYYTLVGAFGEPRMRIELENEPYPPFEPQDSPYQN